MKLTSLKNIGKEMSRKLNNIGIHTSEELLSLEPEEVFFRLKIAYPEVCLVHLHVIYGAIHGQKYNKLPENIKHNLKKFNDSL